MEFSAGQTRPYSRHNDSDVHNVITYFGFALKPLGMQTVTIDNKNHFKPTSKLYKIYSALIGIFSLYTVTKYFIHFNNRQVEGSARVTNSVQYWTLMLNYFTILVTNIASSSYYAQIYDRLLGRFSDTRFKWKIIVNIVFISSCVIFESVTCCLGESLTVEFFLSIIDCQTKAFCVELRTMQFAFTVDLLTNKLTMLNYYLRHMDICKNSSRVKMETVESLLSKMFKWKPEITDIQFGHHHSLDKKLSVPIEMYKEFIVIVNNMNKCYGFMLLVTAIRNFFNILNVINVLQNDNSPEIKADSYRMITIITWFIHSLYTLWMYSTSCELLGAENRETNIILNKLLVIAEQENIQSDVLLSFAELVNERKLQITALGFFTVDYEMVYTLFTLLLTYAIVLNQMSGPYENSN